VMASGECALTCVSRARHRSRLVSTNSYTRESILSIIDGTMLLARQAERCFRILRRAHTLVTCAYCLEARRTLDAMRRVRMRVFVALRARFERSLIWQRVGSGWRSRLFGVVCRVATLCDSGLKASVQCLSNTLSRPCLMSKALKFINGETLKVRHPRIVSHLSMRPRRPR
jgi:hypothetical protein